MKRRHGVVAATVGALALLLGATAPSPALDARHPRATDGAPKYFYVGHAGGTQVQALGTTIRSDLTSASGVEGYNLPAQDKNDAAGVNVASGLVRLGAVNTWANAVAFGDGTRMITGARTADVSLLGGLISAKAVETTTTATKTPDGLTSTSDTQFVGLTINGQSYPVNVPKDTTITIPGIVQITLNSSQEYVAGGGSYITGFGMYVALLKPFNNVPAAATVLLNPTQSVVIPAPPPYAAQLGGVGYGSAIRATVGPALDLDAGPSALAATPPGGTGSDTVQNTTASVDVPDVVHVDAVKTWTTGKTIAGHARARMTNQITGLNVLNGLITADVITTSSHVKKHGKHRVRTDLSMSAVNLVVAGHPIPIDVAPNSALDIAGVGRLVLNEQVTKSWGGYVRALHLTLSTAQYGLPVGAEIEVSVAMNYIVT
jgi:hypothetical protein